MWPLCSSLCRLYLSMVSFGIMLIRLKKIISIPPKRASSVNIMLLNNIFAVLKSAVSVLTAPG